MRRIRTRWIRRINLLNGHIALRKPMMV
jgi:hypothetical protein